MSRRLAASATGLSRSRRTRQCALSASLVAGAREERAAINGKNSRIVMVGWRPEDRHPSAYGRDGDDGQQWRSEHRRPITRGRSSILSSVKKSPAVELRVGFWRRCGLRLQDSLKSTVLIAWSQQRGAMRQKKPEMGKGDMFRAQAR